MTEKAKITLSSERRQSVRAKRVLSIQYRRARLKKDSVATDWHLSTTEDMSLDGVSFYSEIEFRAGDKLEIRVVMSGVLDIFNGTAKVVRSQRRDDEEIYFVAVKYNLRKTYQQTRKAKTHNRERKI